MSIFKLFRRKPGEPAPAEAAGKVLDRFATATIMGVDTQDIGRYPAKQHKVMAFHFGAVEYLAGEFGLDETGKLGLFVMFLDKYFNMPVTETGSISERIEGFRTNREERRFVEAGADVCHRWHEENERRAPLQLGEMLKDG